MTAQAIATQQNLILRSEEFDNASWTNANVTVSANTDANPLTGALTADRVAATTNNSNHQLLQAAAAGTLVPGDVCCLSIYAKWLGANEKYIVPVLNQADGVWVDLQQGIPESGVGTILGASVEAVPGQTGWWHVEIWARCTTNPSAQGAIFAIAAQDGVGTFVGSNAQSQVWWGAQLTKANQSGAYTQTVGTIVNTGGIRNLIGRDPA